MNSYTFILSAFRCEMKRVRCFGYTRAVVMGIFNISGPFLAYITFLAYAARGGYIAAEDAFVAISLLRAVRVSTVLFYPFCIQLINETSVSLSRIQVFDARIGVKALIVDSNPACVSREILKIVQVITYKSAKLLHLAHACEGFFSA